jgi:hypothetical protein
MKKTLLLLAAAVLLTAAPAHAINPTPWHFEFVSFNMDTCQSGTLVVKLVDANGAGVGGKGIFFSNDALTSNQFDFEYNVTTTFGTHKGEAGEYVHFRPILTTQQELVEADFCIGTRAGCTQQVPAGFVDILTNCF